MALVAENAVRGWEIEWSSRLERISSQLRKGSKFMAERSVIWLVMSKSDLEFRTPQNFQVRFQCAHPKRDLERSGNESTLTRARHLPHPISNPFDS